MIRFLKQALKTIAFEVNYHHALALKAENKNHALIAFTDLYRQKPHHEGISNHLMDLKKDLSLPVELHDPKKVLHQDYQPSNTAVGNLFLLSPKTNDPEVAYLKGKGFKELGKDYSLDAKMAFEKVVELAPNSPYAAEAESELKAFAGNRRSSTH